MARYLIIGDIHLSDHPPSSCTDTYTDDLFDILQQAVELETSLECDGTLMAGDVVHIKQPSRTSYRLMLRLMRTAKQFKWLGIVKGNHDLSNDRIESVEESQPLGVLFESGVAHNLDGWAPDGRPVYGVPWQQDWSEDNVKAAFKNWGAWGDQAPGFNANALVITHAPLYPPGQELEFEYYPTRVMTADVDERAPWSMIQAVGYCYYGHVHEPHGAYTVGGVTFCNNGAISRGSLHEYNLTRQVQLTCWDSEHGFIPVPVRHRPASEVFRLAEAEEVKDNTQALTEFLETIGRTTIEVTSTESAIEHIRQMRVEPPVEALAITLLENA